MANDVLASRREARRRRILENSEHRLQRITGRNDNISEGAFANEDSSFVVQNGAFSRHTTNGPVQLTASSTNILYDGCDFEHPVKSNYSESKSHLESEYVDTSSTSNELSQDLENHIYTPSLFNCLYSARLHLICLAVLVKILLVINYGFIFGESLVAPLCVVEMTEVLWLQFKERQMELPSGLLGAVLLLSGVSSYKVSLISNSIQILTKIGQDTSVYFFTFVTFHAILEWLENVEDNS